MANIKVNFWKQACRELSKSDPLMKSLITKYKGELLRSRGNAFETLLRSIVGQQISVKAAQSIWNKVAAELINITPEAIQVAEHKRLRNCGLSERKVEYCKDLAKHFLDKSVNPHHWQNQSDDEVIEELTQIRGIGRWTAEMFLIFHLMRPNVFPADDLGLQKAISILYKKRYPMSKAQLELFRKKYSPWASVATWYLWRSLDPIPVEY